MFKKLSLYLIALAFGSLAFAEEAAPPPPCSAPEYDQFDFWLGQWTSYTADGKEQGHNHLIAMMGNCVIQENWTGVGGQYKGTSYNFYDARNKQWHQTWVDNVGGHLFLSGGMVDNSMQLSGDRVDREGKKIIDRITWTPLEDGRVRQHWEVSEDDGKTWSDAFDGFYQKKTKEGD